MPYVQRDSDGNIKGVYAKEQSGYAEEFLPDDNAEVVDYIQRFPPPDLTPMTHEDMRRLGAQYQKHEEEHQKIRSAMLDVLRSWADLEVALSALLYEILRLDSRSSKIPYAIYYTPAGLEGRIAIVNNSLEQLILENHELDALQPLWKKICGNIKRARDIRNVVAHGSPITLHIRDNSYVRLTAPAFDVIRVGRKISERKIPGLSATDLAQNIRKVRRQIDLVDEVNRIIDAFHSNAKKSLEERIRTLQTLVGSSNNS